MPRCAGFRSQSFAVTFGGTGVNRWLHPCEVAKPYAVLSRGQRGVNGGLHRHSIK
jgi:hypothetical protein